MQVPSLEAADVEAEACAVVPGPPDCKPVSTLLKMVSDFPIPSRNVTNQTAPGGAPELIQHYRFQGKFMHLGARALHGLSLIWFCCIARLSQWEGGVQMISTCLASRRERRKGRGWVGILWVHITAAIPEISFRNAPPVLQFYCKNF